jgi:hypothetical protein
MWILDKNRVKKNEQNQPIFNTPPSTCQSRWDKWDTPINSRTKENDPTVGIRKYSYHPTNSENTYLRAHSHFPGTTVNFESYYVIDKD